MSVRENTDDELNENLTWQDNQCEEYVIKYQHTCMAIYARDPLVTNFMPWRYAFLERVAFGSLSTELGDVKTCLKPYREKNLQRRCC
jgi:hypothetical protein